jgi:hypothetical protein
LVDSNTDMSPRFEIMYPILDNAGRDYNQYRNPHREIRVVSVGAPLGPYLSVGHGFLFQPVSLDDSIHCASLSSLQLDFIRACTTLFEQSCKKSNYLDGFTCIEKITRENRRVNTSCVVFAWTGSTGTNQQAGTHRVPYLARFRCRQQKRVLVLCVLAQSTIMHDTRNQLTISQNRTSTKNYRLIV